MTSQIDFHCLVATLFFAGHIVANFVVAGVGGQSPTRFENLSLFPPFWVFAIWPVIWALQGTLLYQSYGSGFWTAPLTFLFIMMCVGNIGSQLAGAKGWGAPVYLAFIFSMLASSFLFLRAGEASAMTFPVLKAASQLYVGWATIACVVGLGVVLVCERQNVADSTYSSIGLTLVVAAPILIWIIWINGRGDYRILAAPFIMVLVALSIRAINSGRPFLRSSHS